MANYAIGDVQGCYKSLQALLQEFNFSLDKDKLWFTGDLVNRGPQSLEVLRFIRAIKDNVRIVLGNHDLYLLALGYGIQAPDKAPTLLAILNAADKLDLLDWLRKQPLCYFNAQHKTLMVHAGILPNWHLTQVLSLAEEVQRSLENEACAKALLEKLYTNKPRRFKDKYQGNKRLHAIINVLTRIRFCQADGRQNFTVSGEASKAPVGYQPWYNFFAGKDLPFSIIFGHWAALRGQCPVPGFYAVDTGCVWGESLTALRVSDKKRFSVQCKD